MIHKLHLQNKTQSLRWNTHTKRVCCYMLCVCVCFAGVLLHIMADTLGSVGVIISALLMQKYDLMIADPICSMLISLLIGVR